MLESALYPEIVNDWQLLPTLVARMLGELCNHPLLPKGIWLRPTTPDVNIGGLPWKRFTASIEESLSKMKDSKLTAEVRLCIPSDFNQSANPKEFAIMMVETAQYIAWVQYQHNNPDNHLGREEFAEHAKSCAHCFGSMASTLDEWLMAIAQEEHSFFHGHDVTRIVQEDLATKYAMSLSDVRAAYKGGGGDISDQVSYYESTKNNLLWRRGPVNLKLIAKHCFAHQNPRKLKQLSTDNGTSKR